MVNLIKNIVRYTIALLFLISALTKIVDIQNTVTFFTEVFGMEHNLLLVATTILILIELFIVYRLFINDDVWVYRLIILMLGLFILISTYFIYQDISNCGCFGTSIESDPVLTIIKNLTMILGATYLIVNSGETANEK